MRLEDVVEVAKKSGEVLRENFGKRSALSAVGKGEGGDITRLADKLAEDAAIKRIRQIGNCEIISEEAGRISVGDPKHRWILDPLDGTANFTRGIPLFAVSIQVETLPSSEPVWGVVYEPMTGRCFYAEKGRGAFLNKSRIETNRSRRLEDCLFYLDLHFGADKAKMNKFIGRLRKIGTSFKTFRTLGSCALALSYTAMGTLDGFLDLSKNSRIVDIAAGVLILEEAGGKVTDVYGNPIADGYDTVIACSSDHLNLKVRKLLYEESTPEKGRI